VADEMRFILAFTTFLVMSLSQISLVCYFADLLMMSSIEISDSVYKCPWYEADEDSKRTILFTQKYDSNAYIIAFKKKPPYYYTRSNDRPSSPTISACLQVPQGMQADSLEVCRPQSRGIHY
ncbi:hypothetical protein SFRURICE_010099, partial [Spodoptera frugiperda]